MNTKQQLESLDIWLKDAYAEGYKDASKKMSPESFSIDVILVNLLDFLKGYNTTHNMTTGETYFTDGSRAYSIKEIVNKFKLKYGYDEE